MVSIGTIFFYYLFRWVFDIKLGFLPLKEDLLNFWIPFLLPWIPIFIWLRRRNRILKVKGSNDNGHFFYSIAMAIAMAVPILISQVYIEKSSFDLVSVSSVSEIKNHKDEKYFEIKSFRVKESASLSYMTSRTSGKHNESLHFYLYQASSFQDSEYVWHGVKFSKKISNRINEDIKNSEYTNFSINSQKEFSTYDFQNARYFEKVGYSDDRDGYIRAIEKGSTHLNKLDQIIITPKTEAFEERLGNNFLWIFYSYGIGAFIILLMVVIPKVDEEKLKDFKNGTMVWDDDLAFALLFFDPRGPNKATAILLLLNVLVFVVMILSGISVVSPTSRELLEIGGNRRFEVLNGEYWRLLTSTFIHSGLGHLLMNMIALVVSAIFLEGILGRIQLIGSYVICGILASLASIYWYDNTVSVGASGAIFGLYGLILAFTVFKIYSIHTRRLTWMVLGLFAGIGLLFGFLGGIDNAAHIGGLISGFLLGGLFILIEKEKLIKNSEKRIT